MQSKTNIAQEFKQTFRASLSQPSSRELWRAFDTGSPFAKKLVGSRSESLRPAKARDKHGNRRFR